MNLCVLNSEKTTDGWRHVCQECETVYNTCGPQHYALCRKPRGRCVFRGEKLSLVPCPYCKARAQITVFACEIHDKCSVETNVGEQVCITCKDHQNG